MKREILDGKKVLAPFTREEAVEGTFGYFGDTHLQLEDCYNKGDIRELVRVDEGHLMYPFYSGYDPRDGVMGWDFFLPASYEKAQEAWIKKYEVGVGDVLEVTKHWSFGENEFYYSAEGVRVGDFGEIVRIYHDEIRVKDERGEYKRYPYFAVKKVTSSYKDRQTKWVTSVGLKVGDKVRVVKSWTYGDKGCRIHMGGVRVGDEGTVVDILDRKIRVKGRGGWTWVYPYFVLERLNETHTNISKEIKTKLVSAIQDLDIAVEEATIELRNLERVFRSTINSTGDGDAGVTHLGEFTLTVTAPFFYDGEEFSVEKYDFFDEVLKDSWE